jgi:demethylmenaquinone methyltransferase/2-methoxy-6-polyprenyl-1,4-benzoquinol methylase
MDEAGRKRMLQYYDERAPEYDEAYTRGTGTSSIRNPAVFIDEAVALATVVHSQATGHVLDLACGTAYWFPHYADRCSAVTLVDQSAAMLAHARRRVTATGPRPPCSFIHADVFEHAFEPRTFDFALVGFLLSHLTVAQQARVFHLLRQALTPHGSVLILESAWSAERQQVNEKIEIQNRSLNDGTTFEVYKQYISPDDIGRWSADYGIRLETRLFGAAFCAVSGTFDRVAPADRLPRR